MNFLDFIKLSDMEKVILVEVKVGKEIQEETWTATGSGSYWCSFDDGEAVAVSELLISNGNTTNYAKVASIATCDSTTSSFYFDYDNQRLYVHTSGDDAPDTVDKYNIVAYFWVCITNQQPEDNPVVYAPQDATREVYYLPYLDPAHAQSLLQQVKDFYTGIVPWYRATLKFLNDGWWYGVLKKWLWHNKDVEAKVGQKGSDYADFEVIIKGKTRDPAVSDEGTNLEVKDARAGELKSLPLTKCWKFLPSGLVGYWPLDEGSGMIAHDKSEFGNDGTLINMEEEDWVDGKVNKALNLDGVNEHVNVLEDESLNITGELTAEAWVYPTEAPTGVGRIVATRYDWDVDPLLSRGWTLGNNYGSLDVFYFFAHYTGGQQSKAQMNGFFAEYLNKWTHVVGVFKPSQYVRLYINGVKVAEDTTDVIPAIAYKAGTPLRMGARADNPNQGDWKGIIDEVRIYNRALSAGEIQALYEDPYHKYPDLEDEADGREQPVLFGKKLGITPICIDTVAWIHKVNYYAQEAIDAVYKDEEKLVEDTDYTVNADKNEFTLLEDPGEAEITCDARGVKCDKDAGTYSENIADILWFVLKTMNNIPVSRLDESAFDALKSAHQQRLAWYMNEAITTFNFIRLLQQTSLFQLIPLPNGKYTVKYYTTGLPSGSPKLREEDYSALRIFYRTGVIFSKAVVKFDRNPTTGEWKTEQYIDPKTPFKYDDEQTLTVESALFYREEAKSLADMYCQMATIMIKGVGGKVSAEGMAVLPTEKIEFTKSVVGAEGEKINVLDAETYRILELRKDFRAMETDVLGVKDEAGSSHANEAHDNVAHANSHGDMIHADTHDNIAHENVIVHTNSHSDWYADHDDSIGED